VYNGAPIYYNKGGKPYNFKIEAIRNVLKERQL